jgi:hypothetical protein
VGRAPTHPYLTPLDLETDNWLTQRPGVLIGYTPLATSTAIVEMAGGGDKALEGPAQGRL